MKAVDYVEGEGRLLAIVVRADFDERGMVSLTDEVAASSDVCDG